MKKTVIHRDCNIIENVDFDRLNKILEWKGIAKPELSRRCGYYDGYITKHVFGEKRLNQTVANTLEKVYGVSQNEYTYKETKKSISNDGQLALRLDKDLITKFRNWAFYNQLSQKDAMEKMLSEYLDGKKTTTTASNDDSTDATISNNDTTDTTASNDDMYEFTIKLNGKLLKELALKSVINHISIEDFVLNCVLNEIGGGRKE